MCGITNPTKPIGPAQATENETNKVKNSNKVIFKTLVFKPITLACSSPIKSKVNALCLKYK